MISLVIPVYNVEQYIVKCLDSVINQDYQEFELLLVNDGTKDNSVKLIEEHLSSSSLNWRIIHKENGGLASARNTGIKEAKGEYVAFLDADDAISPDFLSKLLSNIEEKGGDFVFCAYEFVKEQVCPDDDNGKVVVYGRQELMEAFLKRTIAFVVPSMMFRRSFLFDNDVFFNEKIRFSEDQPFIWDAILHSDKSVYLYQKMYGYYVRENSIMTSSSAKRIMDSYQEYKNWVDTLGDVYPADKKTINMIIPRWCLGALYSAARLTDYPLFKEMYDGMEGKKIYDRIADIHDRNSYLLGFVAKLSPRLLYRLCKFMNR